MKGNKLTILAIATAVVLVLAVVAVKQDKSSVQDTQMDAKLFPGLADKINSVQEMVVSQGPDKVTIKYQNNEWQVVESDNYPADLSKVKQTIIKMADFSIIEAKTSKEGSYSKLGVEDPDDKNAKSKLITLKNGDSNEVASLIVGKQRSTNISNSGGDSLYVRKAHDKQSWLVKGELYADLKPRDWIRSNLFSIPIDRIHKVVIKNSGKSPVTITKEKRSDKDYTLANMPKKKVVSSTTTLKAIAEGMQNVMIKEAMSVSNDKAIKFEDAVHTEFTTFDGLVLSVDTQKKGAKHYAKFSAKFDQSLRVEEPAPPAEPVKTGTEGDAAKAANPHGQPPALPPIKDAQATAAEAAELQQKLESWIFVISDTKAENLRKKMEDLVKDA